MTDLNALITSIENLSTLADTARQLDQTLATCQTFTDPAGLGTAMSCGEADDFVDLLDALGLPHHADNLRRQHAERDDSTTVAELHSHWGLEFDADGELTTSP
jgi:voltage-gated potassium channel Kch